MKWFVFSDAHSFYTPLMTALTNAGFDKNNPNHGIISCGDLLDRGPDTIKILEFVLSLPKKRTILIRGNHDYLLHDLLSFKRDPESYDYSNGTLNSIAQLNGYPTIVLYWQLGTKSDSELITAASNNPLWKQYWKRSQNYAIINNNVFVHGYCTYDRIKDWKTYTDKDWYELTWENGHKFALRGMRVPDKIVYFGHYHNSFGHLWQLRNQDIYPTWDEWDKDADFSTVTYADDDGDVFAVGLDACTALTGVVNVAVVDDDD